MTEQIPNPLSLTDQILEALFLSLENQDGFDKDLIQRLHDLANSDEFTKSVKLTDVLKSIQGE